MDTQRIDPQQLQQMQQMRELEKMKRQLMSRLLTREAFERLGRVRTVNPQLASTAELYLLQLHQAGQLKPPMNEDQLKQILGSISQAEKKDFTIKRK